MPETNPAKIAKIKKMKDIYVYAYPQMYTYILHVNMYVCVYIYNCMCV